MADNKQKKVDWKDALSDMAIDPEDVLDVNVDGQVTRVYRGKGKDRLSDAQWEEAKKNAVKSKGGSPGMSPLGQAMELTKGATPSEKGSLEEANKKINDTSDKAMSALPSARKQKGPVKALASLIAEDAAAEKDKPAAAPVVLPSKQHGGDPVSVAAAEDSKVIPLGALRDSVRGNLLTPEQQRAEESRRAYEAADARGNATGEADLNSLNENATGLRQAITDVVTNPVGMAQEYGPRLLKEFGSDIRTLNPFAEGLQGAPDEQQMAAREDLGLDPKTGESSVVPPQVPIPPVAPDGSGSQSASMSASVTPSVHAPSLQYHSGGDGGVGKAMEELAANNEKLRSAHEGFIQTREGILEKEQAQRLKAMQDMEASTQLAIKSKLNAVEESKRYMTAQQATLAAAREAASSPIDPNRYWNSKSDGQRAMAIVAGALFGFTGQGMNWLQRIDGLVENDNRLQAADRASRVQGLQAEAQGLGHLGEIAMWNGATIAEAHLMEKQAKYEQLQIFVQGTAAQSQNAEIKVKAAEMSQNLAMQQANLAQQQAQLAEMRASHRNDFEIKQAQLKMEADKTNATIRIAEAKAAGDNGLQPMKPAQQERLAEVRSVAGHLRNMWKDYNRLATSIIPGKPGVTSVLPENVSDSARWNGSKADQYTQIIGKPLEGGVVREQDTARYRKSYIPNATDVEGLAKEKVRTLIEYAAGKYESEYRTMRDAGVDMRTTPTPEQFRKELEASTFSPAPAYATEK